MQASAFEAELKSGGYVEIETKSIDPRPANDTHIHGYDIKGLVLDGLFTVIQDGKPKAHRAGDVFSVPAGTTLRRRSGRKGRRFWWGRSIEGALFPLPLWERVDAMRSIADG